MRKRARETYKTRKEKNRIARGRLREREKIVWVCDCVFERTCASTRERKRKELTERARERRMRGNDKQRFAHTLPYMAAVRALRRVFFYQGATMLPI